MMPLDMTIVLLMGTIMITIMGTIMITIIIVIVIETSKIFEGVSTLNVQKTDLSQYLEILESKW